MLSTSKLAPPGADSQVGSFVYILGPLGSLQRTLLWGWEFLPPPQPPQVFTVRSFEAFFSWAGTLDRGVCLAPQLFLLVCPHANVDLLVLQPPLCLMFSPPWLPVSAPPTHLNECFFFNSGCQISTVWYSVTSGYFFFQICCCPCFGCARRQGVYTYASILAGSPLSLSFSFPSPLSKINKILKKNLAFIFTPWQSHFIFLYVDFRERKDRERDIDLLFHLRMHSVDLYVLDWGLNPQPWCIGSAL